MQTLTPSAEQALGQLAQRYGVSLDAARTLLMAVAAGGGSMAQFNHPELGGGGQWMSGGMTMVGDMFNSGLQNRVSGLCAELSNLLSSQPVFATAASDSNVATRSGTSGNLAANQWWPAELGSPSSSGGQNDLRYADFPQTHRLAVQHAGVLQIYDTLDHQIGGVQQQQGVGAGSLSFSSQRGTFTVASLPRAPQPGSATSPSHQPVPSNPAPPNSPPPQHLSQQNAPPQHMPPQAPPQQNAPQHMPPQSAAQSNTSPQSVSSPSGAAPSTSDILAAIERLGHLHQQGVLSTEEFQSKKTELLMRL